MAYKQKNNPFKKKNDEKEVLSYDEKMRRTMYIVRKRLGKKKDE